MIEDLNFACADDGDLIALQEEDVEIRAMERIGVRGNKGFVPRRTMSNGDRVFARSGNDLVGVVLMDDGDPPKTLEKREGFLDGSEEIAIVGMVDELSDDFGIGVGRKDVPFFFEHVAQSAVVFDDPVMDNG